MENNRVVEDLMRELQQSLKMWIKSCKHKVSSKQVKKSVKSTELNEKQNSSMMNIEGQDQRQKVQQIEYLKKKLKVERQLAKQQIVQIMRQNLKDDAIKSTYAELHSSRSKSKDTKEKYSFILAKEITPFDQHSDSLNLQISNADIEISGSKFHIVKDHQFNSSQIIEDHSKLKRSKTLANLKKIEALVALEQKRKKKVEHNNGKQVIGWDFQGEETSKKLLHQENMNLKTIMDSLYGQIALLQKYRNVPEANELICKEATLKKKEDSLKQLQEKLNKREIQINTKYGEGLRRRRDIKVL